MDGYAQLAKFLSRPTEFARASEELANAMGSMFQAIKNDDEFMVDFLCFLGAFTPLFGFADSIYTFSGKIEAEAFAGVVSQKILFRDAYTRNHGEFSHTVQWLVMAYRFDGRLPVAELYANSVKYSSYPTKVFDYEKGGKSKGPADIWNFLVDCFEGDENFRENIMCRTFRVRQIVTNKLNAILPSKNWLGEFLYQRRHLGLKKERKPPPGSHYDKKRDIVWRQQYLRRMLSSYYDPVGTGIYRLKDRFVGGHR